MKLLLGRMLDEAEFLSPHGIRALSRFHLDHPYVLDFEGSHHEVRYEPAESRSGLFGGNSNWRGPVWFPLNYLLIEALQKFDHYYGLDFQVPLPAGGDDMRSMGQVADELGRRLESLFLRDDAGRRPFRGPEADPQPEGGPDDLILFHEYFDGDSGRGLGASHQTGWTALVAKLLEQRARRRREMGESAPAATTPDATADEMVVGR
jgi:hypothetical protein